MRNDGEMQRRPSHTTGLSGKVFGVGLARTGTTSLHHAMGALGLQSAPDSVALLDAIDIDFLATYDAFFDNPIPFRFRALDTVCPDSRWIVTQRPVDEWLTSMEWLFGDGLDRLDPSTRFIGDRVHRQVYGSERFDEGRLRKIYEQHYADLADWVEGKPSIWMHLEDGLTWEPICNLLDLPVPSEPFPRSNERTRRRFRSPRRNRTTGQ